MREIEFVFCVNKTKGAILAPIIAWLQGGDSHVIVRFNSTFLGRQLNYDASGSGISFHNREFVEKTYKINKSHKIKVDNDTYRKILQYSIDHLGTKYGYLQIIGLLFILFMDRFGLPKVQLFKSGDKRMVCNELAARIIQEVAGIKVAKDLDSITIVDLRRFLEEYEINARSKVS